MTPKNFQKFCPKIVSKKLNIHLTELLKWNHILSAIQPKEV